ncbi:hypothetical protein ACLMAJ_31065 [Nocardia sp. KC 131]|uniref:hypothetical protein n=1 Tax=Nocardia arseniciresistens TaxID=3392119 RepID=UPI00398EC643
MTTRRDKLRTVLATSVVATHILLTLIENLPDRHRVLARFGNRLPHAPDWRFFGPNPGVEDFHLMYRLAGDDSTTEWKEIDLSCRRPWHAMLWNPGTRPSKALFDAIQNVRRAAHESNGDFGRVLEAPGYRLLEASVESVVEPAAGEPAARSQFMLLTTRPEPEVSTLQVVLVSEVSSGAAAARG